MYKRVAARASERERGRRWRKDARRRVGEGESVGEVKRSEVLKSRFTQSR